MLSTNHPEEHETVCDVCAEFGICVAQGDASVCRECRAFHERAIDHATNILRNVKLLRTSVREQVEATIKAYYEYEESTDG